jgi:uncharacterized protein (DUF433 family)
VEQFDRITHVAGLMGGRATIRGMRVTVSMILGQLAVGQSVDELLGDFPYLEREDVLQAIGYGAWLAGDHEASLLAS